MNEIDITDPKDVDKAGYGADEIRDFKYDIKDRMEIDHHWDNETTTTNADADGRHKKITLPKLDSAPSSIANTGILYTKVVSDITELFYIDNNGNEIQLTENGSKVRDSFIVAGDGKRQYASLPGKYYNGKYLIYPNKVYVDLNGDWDSINKKIDISVSGTYEIKVGVGDIGSWIGYSNFVVTVEKNGTTIATGTTYSSTTSDTAEETFSSLSLIVGDEIKLYLTVSNCSGDERFLFEPSNITLVVTRDNVFSN